MEKIEKFSEISHYFALFKFILILTSSESSLFTWSKMRDFNGDMTIVTPGVNIPGSW